MEKITRKYSRKIAKKIVEAIKLDETVHNRDMYDIISDWKSYWADSNRLSIGIIATIIYDRAKEGQKYDFESRTLLY